MSQHLAIAAIILAGGLSRRFGGADKGLLLLQGKPLVTHVAERLKGQVGKILINSNRHRERYAEFGYDVIADTIPGHPGPLGGVLAGVESTDAEFILAVPCDMPRLPEDLVERLYDRLISEKADLCTPHDGERLHPVVMLVRRTLAPSLRTYLEQGHRKVRDWVATQHHCVVDFSDEKEGFINLNTPEDLTWLAGQ